MKNLKGSLIFLAGSIVGGLALAFLLVLWKPELLSQGRAPDSPVEMAPHSVQSDSETTPTASRAAAAAAAAAPASYRGAVRRASPAVVNIYTARLVTERLPRNPLAELFGDLGPRYRQRVERALGSGVIVDSSGHIVTNHHVIAQADSIRVQLEDGRVAEARIVGRDPDTDLAVLRVDLPRLPVMPLGRSDALQVGDIVLAIGNPVGLSQTVTHGIVSATGRGQLGVATFENFIQTDAAINVGNSGGALVNTDGDLIGINTAIIAKNLGVEGIGFAIPVNLVRGVTQEIIANGRVVRGWIGIAPEDVDDSQAAQLGLARGGVVITNLYLNSPAQASGLQPGDIVLALDGAEVRSAQDTLARIARKAPRESVRLKIQRGTQQRELELEVIERPRGRG
mgnify:CR=1 FL=1